VFPSDRAMAALVAKGLLSELDRSRLASFRHLDPKFLGPRFDPQNRFSVPYFWGTLAVGIRTDFVKESVHGMDVLFDPLYRGRITMLDDMENVVAAVLGHLGLPLNSVEPEHLARAQRLLLTQKPLVQAYTSDSYRERLIAGDAWASLGWSGDLMQADAELELSNTSAARVRVIIPPQGTLVWMDSMAIPRNARNVELAHEFIDYLLDPAVAALNAQKVNYATPNVAARALLPPDMLADERIYPPPELLDRCTQLASRGADIEKIEQVWRVVRA
jgi:spermidine/putrescine transport system substrate-binding protein